MSDNLPHHEDDPGTDQSQVPVPGPGPSSQPQQEGTNNNQSLSEFFLQEDVKSQLVTISLADVAPYKNPLTHFHNIINVLCVSRGKKVRDCQKGSEDCEIMSTYREWVKKDSLMKHIVSEVSSASRKLKSQKSMKDFFKPVSSAQRVSADQENNNSSHPAPRNNGGSSGITDSTSRKGAPLGNSSLLQLLEISEKDESLIKGLSLDEDLLRCKIVVSKIRDFRINEKELTGKQAWDVDKCNSAARRKFIKTELAAAKESFTRVASLCDKEKNLKEAQDLPIEEIGKFITDRVNEASALAKKTILRLLSNDLLDALRDGNHYMRRRISNIDKSFAPNPEILFSCSNAESSWEHCLKKLEDMDWKPTVKNGNVKLEHFYSCAELFRSMEFRGDEFIPSTNLLSWIKLKEKPKTVLNTLVKNLPILMAEKNGRIALINVVTFMKSQTLVEEMMTVSGSGNKKSNIEGINVTEGTIPDEPRRDGSGRPRIFEQNPEVLDQARVYAESAGVAAHSRRRSEVGRFGFNINEITRFLKNTCFQGSPDSAPSESTVRRIFEAPSLSRSSKSYYKADISARPGVKRNDEIATGEAHPHRHECFACFKIAREFGALFEDECNTISADDKAKIPIGIPAVHRLNSLNNKFFLRDQGPNHPDHDVLRTGSLITPRGYMILRRKTTGSSVQTDVEMNDMSIGAPTEEPNLRTNNPRTDISDEENVELFDDPRVELPLNEVVDEISQLDGADDNSSESGDEFEMDFLKGVQPQTFRGAQPRRKRQRIESEQEDSEEEVVTENNAEPTAGGSGDNSSPQEEEESAEEEFEMPEFPAAHFVMKEGRKHVAIAHTGPTYVFFASHQKKPSTISRHVNDILTIAEVDRSIADKPNLILLLDDGQDWGGRGLQTLYYFGELWRRLNLDLLIIARNAPGDSRHNPVEHYWGFENTKLSGVVLPAKKPDQTVEESEDSAIETLIESCLKDLVYDGHPVTNVHVPCSSSTVRIGDKDLENDHISEEEPKLIQAIMENKKMDKRTLRQSHPEIYKRLQNILKHVDIRLHGFIFRKCHPRDHQCDFCKENPRRSSDKLWKCLPRKSSGGLFYDIQPDPNMPGHYRTLLDMMGDGKKIKIKPDGMFEDVFGRCQENGCMVSFKCKADADRHFRLAHKNWNTQRNPFGHVCTFKINNVPCGQSFETDWLLKKHKNATNHINRRVRRGGKT